MSSPKYRLIYQDLRVLGEPIRFLFHYLNIPYEDVIIETDNEWPKVKDTLGWGKVPILEVDGKQLSQSHAIGQYIARKYNLEGADTWEAAKCSEYVGVAQDLRMDWRRYWFESNKEKSLAAKKDFVDVTVPKYMGKLSKELELNGGKFLVGSGLTWADLYVVVFLELFEDTVDKDILQVYPLLQKYKSDIFNIPQIKKYIENRPPYKF